MHQFYFSVSRAWRYVDNTTYSQKRGSFLVITGAIKEEDYWDEIVYLKFFGLPVIRLGSFTPPVSMKSILCSLLR